MEHYTALLQMLGPGVSYVWQCCREQELSVRAPPRPQPWPRPGHRRHCSGRHFLLRESAWTGHKYTDGLTMKDIQYLIQNLENPAFPPQWSMVIGQGTMNWWNEMENTLPHGQARMLSLLTLKLPRPPPWPWPPAIVWLKCIWHPDVIKLNIWQGSVPGTRVSTLPPCLLLLQGHYF